MIQYLKEIVDDFSGGLVKVKKPAANDLYDIDDGSPLLPS